VTATAAGLTGRKTRGNPRGLLARADWVLWLLVCCMAGPPVPRRPRGIMTPRAHLVTTFSDWPAGSQQTARIGVSDAS